MHDNLFNIVIFADVIEHLIEREAALVEITRILKPRGMLLLSSPNENPRHVWDKCHVREFTPDSLRSLLTPHFSEVTLHAWWPMHWYYRWAAGALWQRFIGWVSRMGYNPFCKLAPQSSLAHGQLIAVCRK